MIFLPAFCACVRNDNILDLKARYKRGILPDYYVLGHLLFPNSLIYEDIAIDKFSQGFKLHKCMLA